MLENSFTVVRPYLSDRRGIRSYILYPLNESLYTTGNERIRRFAHSVFPPVDLSNFGLTTIFRPGPDLEELELVIKNRLYTTKFLSQGDYPMFFPQNRLLCAVVPSEEYPKTNLYIPMLRRRLTGTRGTLRIIKHDAADRLEIPFKD